MLPLASDRNKSRNFYSELIPHSVPNMKPASIVHRPWFWDSSTPHSETLEPLDCFHLVLVCNSKMQGKCYNSYSSHLFQEPIRFLQLWEYLLNLNVGSSFLVSVYTFTYEFCVLAYNAVYSVDIQLMFRGTCRPYLQGRQMNESEFILLPALDSLCFLVCCQKT
jgi:hypothetical protein